MEGREMNFMDRNVPKLNHTNAMSQTKINR